MIQQPLVTQKYKKFDVEADYNKKIPKDAVTLKC